MTDGVVEFPGHIGPGDLPSEQPRRRFVEKRHLIKRDMTGKSPTERCQTPADLPHWAKLGITRKILSGMKWKQVAEEIGQKPALLYRYWQTPGGKQWEAAIKEQAAGIEDPVALARLGASLEAPFWQLQQILHYEAARAAGDLGEAGRTIREALKISGVVAAEKQQGPAVIVINNTGTIQPGEVPYSVEIEMGDSDHKVIEAEIIDE